MAQEIREEKNGTERIDEKLGIQKLSWFQRKKIEWNKAKIAKQQSPEKIRAAERKRLIKQGKDAVKQIKAEEKAQNDLMKKRAAENAKQYAAFLKAFKAKDLKAYGEHVFYHNQEVAENKLFFAVNSKSIKIEEKLAQYKPLKDAGLLSAKEQKEFDKYTDMKKVNLKEWDAQRNHMYKTNQARLKLNAITNDHYLSRMSQIDVGDFTYAVMNSREQMKDSNQFSMRDIETQKENEAFIKMRNKERAQQMQNAAPEQQAQQQENAVKETKEKVDFAKEGVDIKKKEEKKTPDPIKKEEVQKEKEREKE